MFNALLLDLVSASGSNIIPSNLPTSVSLFSGCQERQDKLRELGFVDILHKLTQALDPNLCERCDTHTHTRARSLCYRIVY